MTHDPLCGLSQPCDDEVAEHGYCSMQYGQFCIHCQQWCICHIIAKVRQDERERADGQSVILAGDCEKQITRAESDMLAKCIAVVEEIIPDDNDSGSWEVTIAAAWLRHAVSKLRALEEE